MKYHHDPARATRRGSATRALLPGLATALAFMAATPVLADTLLLQQNIPGNTAGTPFLLIDRTRISQVMVRKDTGLTHQVTIRLATEPPVEIALSCNDEAITRQLLEALRRGAAATLDVTGRCRL